MISLVKYKQALILRHYFLRFLSSSGSGLTREKKTYPLVKFHSKLTAYLLLLFRLRLPLSDVRVRSLSFSRSFSLSRRSRDLERVPLLPLKYFLISTKHLNFLP